MPAVWNWTPIEYSGAVTAGNVSVMVFQAPNLAERLYGAKIARRLFAARPE